MKLRDGSLFVSLPGVQQQDRHADYDLDHPNAAKSMIIMAYLSDNGKFIFYKDGKEHVLHSEKGDILVCSGDIEHAGASYDNINIRAHFYGDYNATTSGQAARKKNVTYLFNYTN